MLIFFVYGLLMLRALWTRYQRTCQTPHNILIAHFSSHDFNFVACFFPSSSWLFEDVFFVSSSHYVRSNYNNKRDIKYYILLKRILILNWTW